MNNRTDYFSYLATKYCLKWLKYPLLPAFVCARRTTVAVAVKDFLGDFHETLFHLHTRLIAHKTKRNSRRQQESSCSREDDDSRRHRHWNSERRSSLWSYPSSHPLFPRYRAPLWTTRGGVWLRVRARAKTPHSAFPRKPGVSSRRCEAHVATRREKTERKRDKSGRQQQQQEDLTERQPHRK